MLINSFLFQSSISRCNLNSAAPISVHGSYLYTIQAARQLSEHNQSIKPQSEVTAQPKNARLQFIRKSGKSTLIFLCPLRRLYQHFPSQSSCSKKFVFFIKGLSLNLGCKTLSISFSHTIRQAKMSLFHSQRC